ncbi:MAG: DUF4129 domain-containing protein [Winogradskyella sp.]|uniref:DUF4129 domain-containing protein n=1 Tax=Winogradskyella sp. TaxID=1883156 RepID=UPI00180621A2|nr:DUF4129 domain-containing protein [Winogradskyella sp.]MBT8244878.1 DUF4129 domain-containing protein [Winogradskyella sp.]NNK21836.1 DUF4129 domain-containing protein [Winogradskyella sp.]
MRKIGFLICFCIGSLVFSQEKIAPDYYDDSTLEKKTISENDLESYKNDDDFDYTEVKKAEGAFDKFVRWLRNLLRKFWEAIFGVGTAGGFLYFVFRILPYILLGVLIYLLVRFFLKVNSNSITTKSQAKGKVFYSKEEQIIKNEDIDALIEQAINQKKHRLAIRYYYLLALKKLTEANKIKWEAQKTNEDYIEELNQSHLKVDFENITRIYDYVWYGEFTVDAFKFENLKLPFISLNKTIDLE